jgi:hypothetical protein
MSLLAKVVLGCVTLIGVVTIYAALSQSFDGCQIVEPTESTKLALEQYADTIQQLLTLSTTLVALGAAVLLGFQEGLSLGKDRRILVLGGTVCFSLSAYFALLWKSGLGRLLYMGCPNLVAARVMQIPFDATTT